LSVLTSRGEGAFGVVAPALLTPGRRIDDVKNRNKTRSGVRGIPPRVFSAARAMALAFGAGALLLGCVGTLGAEGYVVSGYPVVRARLVPVELNTYPRVYYRGAYAYLVDGTWYYPTDEGWVIFETEPPELQRYRLTYRRATPRYVPPEPEYSFPRERGRRQYTPR
jgi:hypothetical protein